MAEKNHYLSGGAVARRSVGSRVRIIIGGLLTAIFAFGVIGGLVRYTDDLREYLLIYIVFLVPSVLLLRRGLVMKKQIRAARRYETIFSGDRDGFVSIRELSELTGKSDTAVRKELETLFGNGYFYNCLLRSDSMAGVILPDAAEGDQGIGFVTVKCENCGASTRVRAGIRGQCQYCGAPVRGE